jgi:WD40 repeat protein
LALTSDGASVVALAKQSGHPTELLRWAVEQRGEPVASTIPDTLVAGLTAIGTAGSVVVGQPEGAMALVVDGRSSLLDGTVLALDAAHNRAAVRSDNGAQRLIDVLSGQLVADLREGTVDLGNDRVAVVSDDAVQLLESSTGAELASASIEPAGQIVASAVGSTDEQAVVAATSTGEVLRWKRVGTGLTGEPAVDAPSDVGAVRDLIVSPDGDRLLLVGANGSAVIELATGKVVGLGLGETGVVVADPAGRFVAVGGKRLVLWDMRSGDRVVAVPQPANALAWSGPCDDSGRCRLVTAGESLDVWDPSTGRLIRLEDQTNAQAVAISGDASMVASAGWGPTVALWSVSPLIDNAGREMLAPSGTATSVDPVTLQIARATSTTTVEIGGDDEPVRVDTGAFDRFVLVPNGRRLVTTVDDRLRLFDTSTGAALAVDPACAGDLLTVSPAGAMIAVFDHDRPGAVVCDANSGSLVATAPLDPASPVTSVMAVDDAGNVALGNASGLVSVLVRGTDGHSFIGKGIDVRPGKEPAEVRSLSIRDGVVAAGIQTPAARGAQASVLVWPIDGTPVYFVTDFLDVPAVALIGAAEAVVVAGRDSSTSAVTLQTWETPTRRRLGQSFTGLVGDIVTLGGDTASIVGADASGAVYRWRPTENPTQEICRIVGRPLRRDEWDSALGGALQRYEFAPVC